MHVPGAEGPLFQRRVPLEPTMRCMVVLALCVLETYVALFL
jgi:hypothetical protein